MSVDCTDPFAWYVDLVDLAGCYRLWHLYYLAAGDDRLGGRGAFQYYPLGYFGYGAALRGRKYFRWGFHLMWYDFDRFGLGLVQDNGVFSRR